MAKTVKRILSMLFALTLLFAFVISVSALDNKYDISELKFSVKLPKQFNVVTRDSSPDDENFAAMGLVYEDTIAAFKDANIYLQGKEKESENPLTITITKNSDENSKKINNYSELSTQERKDLLDEMLSDEIYVSGVEKKHADFICFDIQIKKEADNKVIYGLLSNTIVNGMSINFIIQKDGTPLSTDEERILTNMVNSVNFQKITTTGPTFEWWRILLWVLVMAVIVFAVYFIYKQNNDVKKRKEEDRRNKNKSSVDSLISDRTDLVEDVIRDSKDHDEILSAEARALDQEKLTFDEALGYEDKQDFSERALTDLDQYEISVKEKKAMKGIDYFEDGGESIFEKEDYFDKYFNEKTEHRKTSEKAASAIGTYTKMLFRHLGYFFHNLAKSIRSLFSKNDKKTK